MPLNPVARAAIEELRGMGVTNLTPDEIVHLNDLGAAQMRAGNAEGGVPLTPPVRAGNAVLHPMTCAAADFIERWSDAGLDARLMAWAIPFALANGRTPGAFDSIVDAHDVARAVKKWRRGITATRREIEDACNAVFGGDDLDAPLRVRESICITADFFGCWDSELGKKIRRDAFLHIAEEEKKSETAERDFARWRKFAVELAAVTGTSPEYWMTEDRRLALLALKRANEMALARAGVGGGEKVPHELVAAIAAMRKEIAAIAARRSPPEKENGSNG